MMLKKSADGSIRKYDDKLLALVSKSLGHNRLDVVVSHYLKK